MGIGKFKRQMDAIEAAVKVREAAKAAHAPYILFRPWDLLRDQFNVIFFPEGNYQRPVKHEHITYSEAVQILRQYPDNLWCQISMGECLEWLFVFHFHRGEPGKYTEEQIDRMTKEHLLKHPQLEQLLNTESGVQMAETLARLPQTAMIRLKDLKKAMSDGGRCNG